MGRRSRLQCVVVEVLAKTPHVRALLQNGDVPGSTLVRLRLPRAHVHSVSANSRKLGIPWWLRCQWLSLCALTAEGPGSVPGWGTKIPQATGEAKKKETEETHQLIPP